MKSPERSLVLAGLLKVFYEGAFSDKYVDKACKRLSDNRQRAFFTRLFMGSIENAILLDEIIRYQSSRELEKIDKKALNILRMSVYQIMFMDAVPDSAALNCAQILCEEVKVYSAKGFVNGVLRNICRKKDGLIDKILKDKSELERLSVKYSIPLWLCEYFNSFITEGGLETLFRGFYGEHFLSLRINEDKISVSDALKLLDENKINYDLINGIPAVTLNSKTPIEEIKGLKDGLFYIQDVSSIKAVMAAEITPGEKIIDVCAAPGGKGLFAASLTGDKGFVSMRDIGIKKIELIRENAGTLGCSNVKIKRHDAKVLDEDWIDKANLVICDVPCSGLGTLGNKPEIKYRLNKGDLHALADIQADILRVSKNYVKKGGRLMFSTCTLGPIENQDNLERFLSENKDFKKLKEVQLFPDGKGSDGFFYSLLIRDGQ